MSEWQTPKTNWEAGETPTEVDANRWESSAEYLKEKVDLTEVSQDTLAKFKVGKDSVLGDVLNSIATSIYSDTDRFYFVYGYTLYNTIGNRTTLDTQNAIPIGTYVKDSTGTLGRVVATTNYTWSVVETIGRSLVVPKTYRHLLKICTNCNAATCLYGNTAFDIEMVTSSIVPFDLDSLREHLYEKGFQASTCTNGVMNTDMFVRATTIYNCNNVCSGFLGIASPNTNDNGYFIMRASSGYSPACVPINRMTIVNEIVTSI